MAVVVRQKKTLLYKKELQLNYDTICIYILSERNPAAEKYPCSPQKNQKFTGEKMTKSIVGEDKRNKDKCRKGALYWC